MEETNKKKMIVIGADSSDRINNLLAAENLDLEFIDNLKEIGKPYEQVLEEMPPFILTSLKQDYQYLYPPVPKKLQGLEVKPVRNSKTDPKHSRNELCPCGSGKKYKHCCL
jgi:uncharacterized protein YecA (UPF0149 family)